MVGPAPAVPDRPIRADWIAADWGTTYLRVWAMADDGTALAFGASDNGMARLTPEAFQPALLDLVAGWLAPERTTPVVACGMVGARQGWTEAAYRAVPCRPLGDPFARPAHTDARISVHIVPGLSQIRPAPDVMRGEETQIAGVLAQAPGWDGVVCLPGTHSKWAEISAGEVVSFRSFLTGELFALLSAQSVLRHAMAQGTAGGEAGPGADTGADRGAGLDLPAFDLAAAEGLARPEALAARLFPLRAESLLIGLAPDVARARLSGLLIGAELAAARGWWLGREIIICGGGHLAPLYQRALAAAAAPARLVDGGRASRAGLTQARGLLPGLPR